MLSNQYTNFLQPVMKLQHKSRNGAKVHKVYDTAKTPYERLLEWDVLTAEQRQALDRTSGPSRRNVCPSVTVTFDATSLPRRSGGARNTMRCDQFHRGAEVAAADSPRGRLVGYSFSSSPARPRLGESETTVV